MVINTSFLRDSLTILIRVAYILSGLNELLMKEEQTTTDKQVWQCRQLAPETISFFHLLKLQQNIWFGIC